MTIIFLFQRVLQVRLLQEVLRRWLFRRQTITRTGERILPIGDLQPGDLVFFGRKDTAAPKVSHVGIYLGEGRFIHSLGLVQIGSLYPDDPLYDAFNAGRYLFGGRVLPYVGLSPELNTTATNPFYAE